MYYWFLVQLVLLLTEVEQLNLIIHEICKCCQHTKKVDIPTIKIIIIGYLFV